MHASVLPKKNIKNIKNIIRFCIDQTDAKFKGKKTCVNLTTPIYFLHPLAFNLFFEIIYIYIYIYIL